MHNMIELVGFHAGMRVIDLGGTHYNWTLLENEYDVTLVNLPGTLKRLPKLDGFTYVEGNACNLRDQFSDKSFDFVFSNSVIEHVGPESEQEKFSEEVHRLAPAYWVQTPSDKFPVEVHYAYPLYWQYKKLLGKELRYRNTRVLSLKRMQSLFADGKLYQERLFGFEKSNSLYRPVR